jgi:signal transduction histidine kinase
MNESTPRGGLRRRLALTLWGLSLSAAGLVGAAFWTAEREVENQTLSALAAAREASGAAQIARSRAERAQRERRLVPWLFAALAATGFLSWWAAGFLARRTAQPMERLLRAIRALDPERRGARLAAVADPELGAIAQALNRYMERLDALVERERAFAAAVSHELRTPLAVIAGAAEVLGASGASPPLARIRRACAQAELDLDGLLALWRDREPDPAAALDLPVLLPQWAEPYLEGLATRLVWTLAPVARPLPAGTLHIVFTNLLRNALRAAGPHGTVTVTLDTERLAIDDDGPGIPETELPLVFEPRFAGRGGGTGIGLYVAHRLAERAGFRLKLHNRAAGGVRAELWFTNPAHPPMTGS